MMGSISSGWSITSRKNSASLRSWSALRLMYFSRSEVLRRKFSRTRASCSSCVQMCGGSSPRSPSASRSAAEKAVPLFSVGSRRSESPRGNHAGTPPVGWARFESFMGSLRKSRAACRVPQRGAKGRTASDRLRRHRDRAAGALGHADAAALAVVVVELEALARSELDHGVVRADAVAVVALEAVAAGKAAAGFEQRVRLVQAANDLVEGRRAAREVEPRPDHVRRVAVIPRVERVEPGDLVLARRRVDGAS